jgi:hypothetical protein
MTKEILKGSNYNVKKVEGDGFCFYNALVSHALALNGSDKQHRATMLKEVQKLFYDPKTVTGKDNWPLLDAEDELCLKYMYDNRMDPPNWFESELMDSIFACLEKHDPDYGVDVKNSEKNWRLASESTNSLLGKFKKYQIDHRKTGSRPGDYDGPRSKKLKLNAYINKHPESYKKSILHFKASMLFAKKYHIDQINIYVRSSESGDYHLLKPIVINDSGGNIANVLYVSSIHYEVLIEKHKNKPINENSDPLECVLLPTLLSIAKTKLKKQRDFEWFQEAIEKVLRGIKNKNASMKLVQLLIELCK